MRTLGLSVSKSLIVNLCNNFNIPYLLDSTPKWSRRGKIRDNIVPAFKVVDENLMTRMMEFCQKSSETLQDYQTLLLSIPIKEIKQKDYTQTIILTIIIVLVLITIIIGIKMSRLKTKKLK